MPNIVILPCYKRPEYLKVTLEQIAKADRFHEMLYVFCIDSGGDPYNKVVIEDFAKLAECRIIEMEPYLYKNKIGKQSRNVLNGLIVGARHADEFVFLIEDDIFIGRDFFTWHMDVHFRHELFCSIATRNHNRKAIVSDNLESFYLEDSNCYQSLGVCYRKGVILQYIQPHFNREYFADPVKYCKFTFDKTSIGEWFAEQDGLIRRIRENYCNLPVAFPHVARAFHAGLYGYNRKSKTRIEHRNFETKVAAIKDICFDLAKVKQNVTDPYFAYDSEPVSLETHHSGLILTPVNYE